MEKAALGFRIYNIMASFRWNFSSSTNLKIGRSVLSTKLRKSIARSGIRPIQSLPFGQVAFAVNPARRKVVSST